MLRSILFVSTIFLYIDVSAQLLENPYSNRLKRTQSLTANARVMREIELAEIKTEDIDGKIKVKFDTTKISHYDVRGNLIKTKRFYSGGYRRIICTYDSENRKTTEAVYDNESTLPMGNVTTWEYNVPGYKVVQTDKIHGTSYQDVVSNKTPGECHSLENGKLKRVTKGTSNAANLTHTSSQYDENGKLIARYVYKVDDKNRMIEEKSFNDDLTLFSTVTYTFDSDGNEIEMLYVQAGQESSGYKDVFSFNEKKLKTELRRMGLDGRHWGRTIFVYEYYK